ncbi:farnesyl-diphosphate farnesyltransferase [Tistlia consotensis]|uniref:Farnesyl-diphosphate farnesyltransferase n=1 Tax=Tistlia consotensis USBA 355 TaxID=560819 RepID=A0A1Y6B5J3_9PROT|nr:presqualene diphosphate synthase HpnD [Tistlia consotensis]SME93397.1 farnesyl-diphosphate farnesyltransferase [Tistlia consotensis USBA 355]SNR28625.1 farnesyl-diphosphate farnesyltransferase [Tistlia consotensis]
MTEAATMSAEAAAAYAEAMVRRSGTSFFWGMRALPEERRRAMYAVYAFCRVVDDIADEPGDPAVQQARLDEWRRELDRLYAGGAPRDPIARALQPAIRRYDLPKAEFEALIAGMEMDLHKQNVAPTMAELLLYCRRVAGAVGLLSIRCFGALDSGRGAREAEQLAIVLGEALQLTNILRDLGEDAADGRLYLPAELLQRHGIASRDPEAVLDDPRLPAVCGDLAALAQGRYAEARKLIDRCDRSRLKPAILMMASYEPLLHRMQAEGWREPRRRISLPKWRKLLLLRHLVF